MEVQVLLEELKAKYPEKEFQVDEVTGKIGFVNEGMFITDPWSSDCGRFIVDPRTEYGITIVTACRMKSFNLPIEEQEAMDAEAEWLNKGRVA